ncbi:polysaccharide biosynthesis protein [Metasolibacillus sp.]|uniref:putative polysaccharide biosynthesis protein n=1 Tax=Metasolibacillus sp. TaxID=2703680 RepID=UPI0025EA047F|nr:polysaccharide biosynthesis protein [Metasolibacillus sp.]MCT6926030.1 polysaccharide biosynthesis protein [Metasolibacillus sp.]MCT6942265.1 polysaccharide biosynthesis protein [Metasolibacillus sp.]
MTQYGMKKYMRGALLLTLAALLVKVLSAVYRVPFQNLVGDEGFYVYQQVYPFISFFVVWTSGGFAVAISKMLADTADVSVRRAISKVIFSYLTVLSLLFFSLLFFGAQTLAQWMGDERLAPLLQTGAFVTLCMPTLALLKGAFQAKGVMEPVAYAQVFEQLIRVFVILGGTLLVMQTSKSIYAAGNMAVLGAVVGEIAGIVLLLVYVRKQFEPVRHATKIHAWPIIKDVTLFSLSVSLSSLMLLGFQLVDSFTVYTALLEQGMLTEQAMTQKGIYDRGQPLVQLGVVIASSLSLAIVPLIAQKVKTAGRGAIPFVQLTYRTALLFGTAAALGLVITMPYVNELLFTTTDLSTVLMVVVVQIIPFSIILTFTAILQGYGKLKVPALIVIAGFIVKWLGNIWLLPLIGISGAAFASDFGLFLSAIFLMLYVKRIVNVRLAPNAFYKTLALASMAMIVVVEASAFICSFLLSTVDGRMQAAMMSVILISVGAATFMTILAKSRVLKEKEWFLIPFGRRMALYQLWLNQRK